MFKNTYINTKALQEIIEKKNRQTKIIAVTKNQSIKAVDLALKNNICLIGENRVQETIEKFKNYKKRKQIELHLIGHLQRNKAKKAVENYDVIETADSQKIINKINKEAKKIKKKQKIYLQINIGKDPKKHGLYKKEIEEVCLTTIKKKHVQIEGVMTILPQKINKTEQKKLYLETKKIQQKIKKTFFKECVNISMGMSQDYEIASKCGATHIRIGTLLYGK